MISAFQLFSSTSPMSNRRRPNCRRPSLLQRIRRLRIPLRRVCRRRASSRLSCRS